MAKLTKSSLLDSNGPTYAANIVKLGSEGKLLMSDKKTISTKGSTLRYTNFSNKEVDVPFPTTGAKLTSELPKIKGGTSPRIMPQDYSLYDIDKDQLKSADDKTYPNKFNRGGVSEGIYACAIFLRFTAKGKDRARPVTEATLKQFILGPKVDAKVKQTIKGTGDNMPPVTFKDDIILRLGLKLADVNLFVNSSDTARIQEAHLFTYHFLCQEIEKQILFTSDDIKPDAIKVGMLSSSKVINSIINVIFYFKKYFS